MAVRILFWHCVSDESLILEIYPAAGGGLVNSPSGTALTEIDPMSQPGLYEAVITEEMTGSYLARVLKSGAIIFYEFIHLSQQSEQVTLGVVSTANLTELMGAQLQETRYGLVAENFSTFFDNQGSTTAAIVDQVTSESSPLVTVNQFSQQALTQIAGQRVLHIQVPTLNGQQLSQPIIRGDSYLAEHSRAIEFSRSDFPDIPTDATVRLTAVNREENTTASFSIEGTVVSSTGVKVVRFEPSSEQTRSYEPGRYEFDVEVKFPDGNVVTFVGPLTMLRVVADITVEPAA